MAELLRSTWSDAVANDPKHRPQVMDWPSTTVRKEWCRRPQEAHVVDGKKIRRMSVAEIAAIQGFPADWVNVDGTTESERIAVLGNAVPPPLSHIIANLLKDNIEFQNKTLIEICAGIGGLSSGFDYLTPIAKIELWDVAAKILRTNKPWPADCGRRAALWRQPQGSHQEHEKPGRRPDTVGHTNPENTAHVHGRYPRYVHSGNAACRPPSGADLRGAARYGYSV